MYRMKPVSVNGLPALTWHAEPATATVDPQTGRLSMTAQVGTDWFNDPMTSEVKENAVALLFVPEGDFALSARVAGSFNGTFDASVLCLWQNQQHWAKLCFEHSPKRERMIVSVVTREISDDANALIIEHQSVYMRVVRTGRAYAFHYSLDGSFWHFVRYFRLGTDEEPMHVGFLVQAPGDTEFTGTFDDIKFAHDAPNDLRNGS